MSSTSSTTPSSTLMSSPLFTPKFVPHRMVWKNVDDVCYECIDRDTYASVVVRLRKFETTNMELYKSFIAKAEKEAIKHECLANLTQILIDEVNKISITVSENPRGITFMKYVEAYGAEKEFNEELQQILMNLTQLFKVLNETGKDLCALPLQHLVIVKNGEKFESMKIRRPFLSAFTKRNLLSPYNRYPTSNPSFVDIASVAFYAFTKQNLFDQENLENALNLLEPQQRAFIDELLNAANSDAVLNTIQNLTSLSSDASVENSLSAATAIEIITPSECDETTSDTSSFGICDDDEIEAEQNEIAANNSDSDYDIVKSIKDDDEEEIRTAIGKEDEEDLMTAIGDEDDECKTAIEDEYDEVKTAIGKEDDDEIKTAVQEHTDFLTAVGDEIEIQTAIEYDETKTAIEDEFDETRTAIENDEDETKTAIEDDEVKTAISEKDAFEITQSRQGFFPIPAFKKVADGFGLHLPNLDKVFKFHPKFLLNFASLHIEGNTLVYKRQFSPFAYRQLVVYCENDEITHVTYEYCYGSLVHGKCNNCITYKRFADLCVDANFCLMEVYIAVANALSTLAIYTFKNYGVDGLTIKFMGNQKIQCEIDDQIILMNKDQQVLVASDAQDKMPSFEFLKNLIADLSKMSENFEKTSNKKFTVTFTEQ
jgi:hypothetical protein